MELPQDLKQAFRTELEQYEQERQMPYITSIEQLAKAEGKAEGKAESQTETALKLLQENIDLEVITRVTGISLEVLRQLQASPEN
jgi:predicted transposase/invertase (TIGR01784 family)